MAYHEVPVPFPKPVLHIEGPSSRRPKADPEFEVDFFGMDDGADREPDWAFRFLFKLGQGLMVHLYVLILHPPESALRKHTFWNKDCAVAEIEMEELGAPDRVVARDLALPVVFRRCTISRPTQARSYRVQGVRFHANHGGPRLSIRLALTAPSGSAAALIWGSADGWRIAEGGQERALASDERLQFSQPA